MKKIKAWIGLAVLLILGSCAKDMDYQENTNYGKDYMVLNFDNVGGLIADIYELLDYDYGTYDGAMLASASDEAQYVVATNEIHDFYNGALDATNARTTTWMDSYTAIQQCNLFLEEYLGLDFPELKLNDDYQQQMFRYRNYENEARFLRAYFYFNLIRQYGDVPFYTEVMTPENINSLSRTPYRTIAEFIVAECDAIVGKIPMDYTDLGSNTLGTPDTGRANSLSVMALKARTLLYMASPLFNTAGEPELWKQAALATKTLLDACAANGHNLNAYTDIWGTTNWQNNEALFVRRIGDQNTLESRNFPAGVEGGNSGNVPTQTLVDAYQMTNGKFWDEPGSGFDPANPYATRDPRLAMSIIRNGDGGGATGNRWPFYNTLPIQTYFGGTNGEPVANATPTGYYLRKLLDRNVDFSSGRSTRTRHNWIIYRVGEFYLNYAEAVFRTLGSADATSADFPMSAVDAVNFVRSRTGVNMPALPTGLSNEDFWKRYTSERMVELAFEGHRFWDLRRWKEAGDRLRSITQMKITLDPGTTPATYTYTRVVVPRLWDDKLYFFPIPQSERMKNPNLTQNPGY